MAVTIQRKWIPTGYVMFRHRERGSRCAQRALRLPLADACRETNKLIAAGMAHASRAIDDRKISDLERGDIKQIGRTVWAGCPACGAVMYGVEQFGRTGALEMVCDGRCMAATGEQCECQCEGMNHGGKWTPGLSRSANPALRGKSR